MKNTLALGAAVALAACKPEPTPSAPESHISACNDQVQNLANETGNTARIIGLGVSGFPEVTSVYEAALSDITTGVLELVVEPSQNLIDAGIGGSEGMNCVAYNGVNEGWTIRIDDISVMPSQSAVWRVTIDELPIDSDVVYMQCGMVPPISNPPSIQAFPEVAKRVFFGQVKNYKDEDLVYTSTAWFNRGSYHESDGVGNEPGSETLLANAWEIAECE